MTLDKLPSDTTLLLVDIQKGLSDPEYVAYYGTTRNNPNAEQKAARLLNAFRTANRPLFIIRHTSVNPGSPLQRGHPGWDLIDAISPKPGETVIDKDVNSAFIGTDLEKQLRDAGCKTVVICGLTTDHCVSTTTRMAANLGFQTYLVEDACATFGKKGLTKMWDAETVHELAVAHLMDEFAQVVKAEDLLTRI
ncbi:isochorismatase hydrolase [Gaertneriomyces semiglobifer]|nr:isochorismatase hydrolase [Gaertneriomyces semiglobifer]